MLGTALDTADCFMLGKVLITALGTADCFKLAKVKITALGTDDVDTIGTALIIDRDGTAKSIKAIEPFSANDSFQCCKLLDTALDTSFSTEDGKMISTAIGVEDDIAEDG